MSKFKLTTVFMIATLQTFAQVLPILTSEQLVKSNNIVKINIINEEIHMLTEHFFLAKDYFPNLFLNKFSAADLKKLGLAISINEAKDKNSNQVDGNDYRLQLAIDLQEKEG